MNDFTSLRPLKIEPLTDFSKADARQAMAAALEQVSRQFGRMYPLVIAGRQVSTAATINSINPSHRRQVIGTCASAAAEQ